MESAPSNIQCTSELQNKVQSHLDPPYEELFDEVEEYALDILYEAWSEMLISDMSVFNKVRKCDWPVWYLLSTSRFLSSINYCAS